MKIPALLIAAALASPVTAQSSDDLWQMLVDAEVALNIDRDGPNAELLLNQVRDALSDVPVAKRSELEVRVEQLFDALAELQTSTPNSEVMAESVRESLRRLPTGSSDFQALGASGGRVLAKLLFARAFADKPRDRTEGEKFIINYHPTYAVNLARDLVERGSTGDFEQAARLAKRLGEDLMTRMPSGEHIWSDPRWHNVLVDLLSDPRLARDTNAHDAVASTAEVVFRFDAVTPRFASALLAAHETMPSQRAKLHGRSVPRRIRTLEPVYVALLEMGRPDERRFAASRLADFDDPSTLLVYADDDDAEIRREVARSLTTRRVEQTTLLGQIGNAQVPALKKLTEDDNTDVRRTAIEAAVRSPEVIEKARWLALAHDSKIDVQLAVAEYPFTHRWAGEILTAVAESNDRAIAVRLDRRIELDQGKTVPFELALARLDHPSLPMRSVGRGAELVGVHVFAARSKRLIDWLADQDAKTLRRITARAQRDVADFIGSTAVWPTEVRAKLQRLAWQATDGTADLWDLTDDAAASRRLVFDKSLDWNLRWKMIPPAGCSPDDAHALFTEVLSAPTALDAENATPDRIRALIHKLRSVNATFLAAWDRGPLLEHDTLRSLLYVKHSEDGARDLAEKILTLGDDAPPMARATAMVALAQEGSVSDAAVNAFLLDPASDDFADVERVFDYVERQRDMTRFPALATLIKSRELDVPRLLANVGSPSALELLLVGAASAPSRVTRSQCLAHAREVQQHLDALERFTSGAEAPTPENAAAELLGMLDDPSPMIRAEAARSLATLGAVEHLPRLVQMMRDEDKSVRSAVREALDRLHGTDTSDS